MEFWINIPVTHHASKARSADQSSLNPSNCHWKIAGQASIFYETIEFVCEYLLI